MSTAGIALLPVTQAAAADITAGRRPSAHDVPADYPTEFSLGIADSLGAAQGVGPFFIAREGDDMVVGEIGGSYTEPGVIEIGYAIVRSCWGRGYASAGVAAFAEVAREDQ